MKVQCASLKIFFLTSRYTKSWVILYFLQRNTHFITEFCLVWFQNQDSFQLTICFTLSLCPLSLYIWLLLASVRVSLQRKAFFARGLLTINMRDWNMWRVNSFFLKDINTLGAWPRAHGSQWRGFHQFQRALNQTGFSYLFWDV